MFVKELKERIIIGAYSFRGEKFSLNGEIMKTPEVLYNIKDKVLRDEIVMAAELVFNFLSGHNFRGRFIPLMRGLRKTDYLITDIFNSGIEYDSRILMLTSLVSNVDGGTTLDRLLLDYCVIMHFNITEEELRSYITFKGNLEDIDPAYAIGDDQTIEDYMSLLFSSTDLNINLFRD